VNRYIVTVFVAGLPRQPRGTKKRAGKCPANPTKNCTDIEGQHHTLIVKGLSLTDVWEQCTSKYGHITRIEEG